jgi:sigma-B regulation protein RsbU (phosphoserine phosphatase)
VTLRDGKIVRDQRMYDLTGVLEHLEKARLDRELATAAEVQNALLSRRIRSGTHYEGVGDSIACRTIGGDFFEFMEMPSGDLAMLLGDVAGKGPAAALLAAMLQGVFTVEARTGSNPSEAVANANAALVAKGLSARFATLVYGVLSRDDKFTYSNAGHNAPVVLTASGVRRCHTGGPIVGAFPGSQYQQKTLQLSKGDAIVMFTDGVTESRNEAGEEFGEERLISCAASLRSEPAGKIVAGILDAVRKFSGDLPPADDITVAVVRRS